MQGNTLFREEALRYRADRLHGSVSLATPLAWQLIGFLLLIALVVAIGFLALASYARVETVTGVVALDKGVATIMPSRPGVIASLAVRDGEQVRAGQVLATVRSEEDMAGGQTAPARIREALGEQDARLTSQGDLLLQAADAERSRLQAQISGLNNEIVSLDVQIADEQRLVDTAAAEYSDVRRVAANGFISKRDLEAREGIVLSRRQQLAQLQQLKSAKQADIAVARRAIMQSAAAAQAQVASAQSDRAALAQQIAQVDLSRGYAITSPVDGTVTALTTRLGQRAVIDQQMMLVVPARAQPRVELYVPTAAAGFLADGQAVRLAIDAFPYQQFGTVAARVSDISTATIAKQGANGPVPVYFVTARLTQPWVKAFGRPQPLLPGMTLTARIVTEKRSLLEWLFEPIFAVRNR